MKIRILGNSIRYRLMQPEVRLFQQEGEIKEVTAFGTEADDKLSFVLKATASDKFEITYRSNTIILQVPQSVCTAWTETELVGFEESVVTGKEETMHVLVEKDFRCLDGSEKDNANAYPNPHLHCREEE